MRHGVALTVSILTFAAFNSLARSQTVYDAPAVNTPGSVYTAPGNHNVGKSGTHSTYGNMTFGSDGSTSSTYGNTTYSNSLDGTAMICSHYGSQTFCNWRQKPTKP
jgi:hypothetical protein